MRVAKSCGGMWFMEGYAKSILPTKIFLSVIIAALILSVTILASTPPVSKDALVHHLAVPKLYLKHGGIHEIPFMAFSYYPMNVNLLYLIPLYFGNDIIPKLIHLVFALLTAWLIFGYLKRRSNTIYALLGVIFFLSTPIVVKLSITAYVDLGLIFFSIASLLLLLKWLESGFRSRFLVLSAVCCGLAMGTKYNGLITFFLVTLFASFIYSRYAQGPKKSFLRAAGYCLVFAGVALLVFSPWMIRNLFWTNNPLYPLYDHWFNPQYREARSLVGPLAFRTFVYHESWWQIALLPVRIFFQGQDGIPQYFDGKLNPFLLLLPITAFIGTTHDSQRLKREKKILLAFALLFFAFTFFRTDIRIRYISPIIPPLILLSVLGIKNIMDVVRDFKGHGTVLAVTSILLCALTLALGLNARYMLYQFRYVEPFAYLQGHLSRDAYISKYRPEYPALHYINHHLPSEALVLFIFVGNRGYYCERNYIFGEDLMREVFLASKNPEEMVRALRDKRITHLLICDRLFKQWLKNNLSDGDRDVVGGLFRKYVRVLYYENGFSLSSVESTL
jgi:hypothetical protein